MTYKTLFGPDPSRCLGISLGVDLVPHKTCNLGCVYCECGATTHPTMNRKEYVSVDRVKDELKQCLSQNENIDYITFSGSGEPTLNDGIGDVIQFIKADHPQYKVDLLTNSTLGLLLNTLDRPATEDGVDPIGPKQLKNISDFLKGAEIVNYQPRPPAGAMRHNDLMTRLVSTIRRRPYTVQDVSQIMGVDVETLQPVLDQVVASSQLIMKPMDRGLFNMAS